VVVERVVQELRTTHPSRRIETEIEGAVKGEWDVDRLQQIASNLIGNAIQHGDPDGVVVVRVDGTAPGTVSLSVANDGTIPEETLPTIFDPFRSGERGQGEGLGLGLYIAQQVAIAHHGQILVTSSPDTGTVFTVTMPRRIAEVVRL
jgi:two-component system, sensor histidine kinase and response regulator